MRLISKLPRRRPGTTPVRPALPHSAGRHARSPSVVPAGMGVAGPGPLLAAVSIGHVISNTTAWITGILAAVATLFLTIGGLRYLMAGGDPGEVEKAKGALRSAAIGYGLAILAPVIVTVLKSLVSR